MQSQVSDIDWQAALSFQVPAQRCFTAGEGLLSENADTARECSHIVYAGRSTTL